MMHSYPEGREAERGLTRREALKRGAMAGLGAFWVAPTVESFQMSQRVAQATSPVPTTRPEVEGSSTTTTEGSGTTQPDVGGSTVTTEGSGTTQPEVGGSTVTTEGSGTTQPDVGGSTVTTEGSVTTDTVMGITIENEEVVASELPFTGLPLEQLLPLAGGAIATGAALVRLARDRDQEPPTEES